MKRARLLAFFLDLFLAALCADAAALAATAAVWWGRPAARAAIPWIWAAGAAAGLTVFLLRDARGGRARRWLGLEAVRAGGGYPGAALSVRRNLPLILPGWNVLDAWPVLRSGDAPRRSDRRTGVRIRRAD